MADFGLSFTRAGSLTTAFFVVSGFGRRWRGSWWIGTARGACCGRGSPSSQSPRSFSAWLGATPCCSPRALLAGAGNAVFHPVDFTVLNSRVSHGRLGHAFSAHGLSGNLGWAAAPVLMTGIAAAAGWRAAAYAAGALAVVALASVVLLRGIISETAGAHEREAAGAPSVSPFAFLGVGAVWMCFLFSLASTMGFGALQNFAPSVLKNVYGLSLSGAASALTVYLLGGAPGSRRADSSPRGPRRTSGSSRAPCRGGAPGARTRDRSPPALPRHPLHGARGVLHRDGEPIPRPARAQGRHGALRATLIRARLGVRLLRLGRGALHGARPLRPPHGSEHVLGGAMRGGALPRTGGPGGAASGTGAHCESGCAGLAAPARS
jgi:hypothetical protein